MPILNNIRSLGDPSKRRRRAAILLIVLGLVGLGVALWLYKVSPQPPNHSVGVSVAPAPSATKPTAQQVASYNVAPDLPKYLNIPSIGLAQTRVMELGLLKNNEIATPNNIHDAGWYDSSAKPGQTGVMFIYGHVSSWQAKGAFYNLKKLKPGDLVKVTRGDSQVYTYKVVETKVYSHDNVDMARVLAPVNPSVPGLNLMTCTGKVIKGTSDFDQRLVVFASLAG